MTNPLERTVRNIYDLAADPHPREGGYRLPQPARPGEFGLEDVSQDILERIYRRVGRRTGTFVPHPFIAQIASAQIIPAQETRFYFFIVNNSALNRIFVGFDYEPNATNGITLEVSFGFYEPWIVPTNAIHVAAAAANTAGVAIVAFD